jgi:hypothetical protein
VKDGGPVPERQDGPPRKAQVSTPSRKEIDVHTERGRIKSSVE